MEKFLAQMGAAAGRGWTAKKDLPFATGFFGPFQYLDNGGRNIDLSAEFFWELEEEC
jgi:hypothetical protein